MNEEKFNVVYGI